MNAGGNAAASSPRSASTAAAVVLSSSARSAGVTNVHPIGWGACAPNPLRWPSSHRNALVCRGPMAQHVHQCAPVAQGIERLPPEQKAAGSNPAGGTENPQVDGGFALRGQAASDPE